MTVINGKWFDRVIVTFLENTDYAHALAQSPLSELHTTHNGTLLINYHGVTHPSQPNYVAFATGDLKVKDDVVRDIEGESLVDLLERKGVSWGSYCEEYPDNWTGEKPFLDHTHGRYVRRHNPFASLKSVQDNPTRAKNIKSAEAFKRELESNTLPSFVFYTPCQDNNAHDTNITYAARYIKNFYTPLTAHPVFQSQRTLFVLTFDESASYLFGQNRVATWLLGNAVKSTPLTLQSQLYKSIDWEWAIPSIKENTINTDKPSIDKPNWYISNVINLCRVALPTGNPSEPPKEGNWNDSKFNHYDILKTIEENWGLGDLGLNDVSAKGFGEVLRRRDERE
ncbi:hypothetical protein HDU79_010087 [Rhizoclosmatium sp. JEL0117]|nr:hypothetical protein HDU79_010087 [Rhizoclosmatium sp. JEL0117]